MVNNMSNVVTGAMTNTYTSTKTEKKVQKEETKQQKENDGVVYEKSDKTASNEKTSYSINKMNKEERSALVQQLKNDQENRQKQLTDLVHKMMQKQSSTYTFAVSGSTDDDSIWKSLASGDYTVDAETKAQAQADIAEDGYYGVKQTSERMFDFACALAGDDEESMKKMQAAIEKGYKQATKAWGKELPSICKDTLDATNKLFEDYYASKKAE
ncbi:putative uncharacterized protein [Clostridium sp. CAG:411]|jgi:flagellar biosynthesis component FlhA|nr:putative uncharacterized protein [Clostridium sp. CAG:411]